MSRMCFGAFNTSTFRKSVEKGGLPDKSSITFEGLFNQYYFKFGGKDEVKELVEPTYSLAQIPSEYGEDERYIGLSLSSSEDGKDHRQPLNCVVVLDISGSMGAFFASDYNDGPIYQENEEGNLETKKKTKMEIANECLLELTKNIKDDEYFGIVLFDTKTEIMQPLRKVSLIDREKLYEDIVEIKPRGGTNMELGLRSAIEMITDHINEEGDEKKNKNNRIVFITDAQPNSGGGPGTLIDISNRAAMMSKIYTTFIGVGLDFNSSLVDELAKIRGSNYFSVHSRREFQKILNEDFNYMVTPLVHSCNLFFESEGLEVEECFGTPHGHSGCLMSIQTVSASPKDERGIKGGIVVIKLKEKLTPKPNPSRDGKLTLQYTTSDTYEKKHFETLIPLGEKFELMKKKKNKDYEEEEGVISTFYETSGVRKAVLLVKFCKLMKSTIETVENRMKNSESDGLSLEEEGSEEGRDRKLSFDQFEELKKFKKFFLKEMESLGDKSLGKELDILDQLIYSK